LIDFSAAAAAFLHQPQTMFLAFVDAEQEFSAEYKAWNAVVKDCMRGDTMEAATWAEYSPECEKKSGCKYVEVCVFAEKVVFGWQGVPQSVSRSVRVCCWSQGRFDS
jgi:hypothetical protein